MSKDAQQPRPTIEQESSPERTIEVLLRLPDVRELQRGSTEPTESAPPSSRRDPGGSQPNPSKPNFVGPVLDSLRRRWSTWKNAAMFAQAGVSVRFVVVGGLVIGMVIAAYLMVDRNRDRESTPTQQDNVVQQPIHDDEPPLATPPYEATLPPELPQHAQVQTATENTQLPVARAPTARLELEVAPQEPVAQPAVHMVDPRQEDRAVYSTDARNQDYPPAASDRETQRYQNQPLERGEAVDRRSFQYESNPSTTTRSPDPYTPLERRHYHRDTRPDPRDGGPYSDGAGFRGTIEPAPYRN